MNSQGQPNVCDRRQHCHPRKVQLFFALYQAVE